jgi:hypothetical protein
VKAGLTAKQVVTNRLVETIRRSKKEITLMTCPPLLSGCSRRKLEPSDAGEFGQAAIGAATGKDGDDVNGFGDQGARDRDNSFLDELLKPAQSSERGARMDGADSPRDDPCPRP